MQIQVGKAKELGFSPNEKPLKGFISFPLLKILLTAERKNKPQGEKNRSRSVRNRNISTAIAAADSDLRQSGSPASNGKGRYKKTAVSQVGRIR